MRENAATSSASRPRFLMCRPRHFAVSYRINPWMDPVAWADSGEALALTAEREWSAYHRVLKANGALIELLPPQPELPDLVFTANAAIVLDRRVLLARFRHPERRREEPHFAAAFRALQARGLIDTVAELPPGLALEGAGDCIWDAKRGLFWMGCGPRSDAAAARAVEDYFGVRCIALELVNPSYYHAFARKLRRRTASRSTAPTRRCSRPMRSASAARSFCRAAARRCGASWRSAAIG